MNKEDGILQAFGMMLGLPGLMFDTSRVCQLRVEGLRLALYDNRARKSMTLLCELSDPSKNRAHIEDWHKFLLEYQFKYLHENTAVIGFSAASEALVAMKHIANDELSLSLLGSNLNALIEWVLECFHQFSSRSQQVPVSLPSVAQTSFNCLSRGHYA